jgi:gliding motility-associated-like protein
LDLVGGLSVPDIYDIATITLPQMKKLIPLIIVFLTRIFIGFSQDCPDPIIPFGDTNLVLNGGFETGDVFPSNVGPHWAFAGEPSGPRDYWVGGLSQSFNLGMIHDITPHTGEYMLLIDGVRQSNATAWEQSVTVQPNKTYYFSAWMTALSSVEKSELIFQVEADGETYDLSTTFIPPDGPEWEQNFGVWQSGSHTSATIRLVNSNPDAVGWAGNDYALDDIEFVPSCVGVEAGPVPDFGGDTVSLCNWGGLVDLNSNVVDHDDHVFTWFYNGDEIDTNTTAPEVLSNQLPTGRYKVCIDSMSCVNFDEIEVVAELHIDLGPDVELCSPSYRLLNTGIIVHENFTIQWFRDGVLIEGADSATFLATGSGTFRVEVTDNTGAGCNGSDEIVISSRVPETSQATICTLDGDNSADLFAIGNGVFEWYDALEGGNQIGSGDQISLTDLTGDTIVYLRDASLIYTQGGLSNADGLTGDQNPTHDFNHMRFTANIDGTLDTVAAHLTFFNDMGGTIVATLENVTLGTTETKTFASADLVTLSGPEVRYVDVPVDFVLAAGNEYRLSILGSDGDPFMGKWHSVSNYYPAVFEVVTFQSGVNTGIYPGLFDWRFSSYSQCERTPAFVSEICNCVAAEDVVLVHDESLTICENETIDRTLTVEMSNSEETDWQIEFYHQGNLVQEGTSDNYHVIDTGSYHATVINPDADFCPVTTDELHFELVEIPTAEIVSGGEACDGELISVDVIITGDGPFRLDYQTPSGQEFDYFDQSIYSIPAVEAGTYSLVEVKNSCLGTVGGDEVLVTYHDLPEVDAGAMQPVCVGGSVTLNGTGEGQLKWEGAEDNSAVFEFVPLDSDWRRLEATNEFGCNSFDSVFVEVLSPVAPEFDLIQVDDGICPDELSDFEIINLLNTGENPVIEWNHNATLLEGGLTYTPAQLTDGDLIEVEIISDHECPDSLTKSIEPNFLPCNGIFIPNAISTNGDGANDEWMIDGINDWETKYVTVFNRWGNIVYENYGEYKPWDGTRNSKPMPVGTYYYVVKVEAQELGQHTYEGSLVIMH